MSTADKRAALELHSLAVQDREWVLSRLPDAERARVLPLLAELDGMEIRFDMEDGRIPGSYVPEAFAASKSAAAEPSPRSVVRDASADDVLRILSEEPAWLVSAVLALDQWPWLAPVQRALTDNGRLHRQAPTWRGEGALPPSGLAATLLPMLARRLRSSSGAPRRNGHDHTERWGRNGSSAWGRVWPKVKQWLP